MTELTWQLGLAATNKQSPGGGRRAAARWQAVVPRGGLVRAGDMTNRKKKLLLSTPDLFFLSRPSLLVILGLS